MLGAFNILKPTGWTSSDVVMRVKHLLRQHTGDKSIKVGHLGTLDPAGSGVLPIVFGKATRLFDYYVNGDKLYRATFVFGKTTDTLDSYGAVTDTSEVIPTIDDIQNVIWEFVGNISQIPPQYSRVSVAGERACDVARRGGTVVIKPREVSVYSIQILDYKHGELTVDIHCSGGTYVRSIARDLADKLGTVAYMSYIIRLENKSFIIENSITLEELEQDIEGNVITLEELFDGEIFVDLDEENARRIMNGLPVPARQINQDYVLKIENKIFGICRDEDEKIKVLIRLWQ